MADNNIEMYEQEAYPTDDGTRYFTRQDMRTETLQRIDTILRQCAECSVNGNSVFWYKCLRALKRECYQLLTEVEVKGITQLFREIELEIRKLNFTPIAAIQPAINEKIYETCEKVEETMRTAMQREPYCLLLGKKPES